MKNLRWAFYGAVAALAIAAPAAAHHSGAMFDETKTLTIEGTVKGWDFTSPHSWLHIMAAGSDGKLVEWSFEAGPPGALTRAGVGKASFKAGDKVSVQTHPMKDGRPAGDMGVVTFADGHKVGERPPRLGPPPPS